MSLLGYGFRPFFLGAGLVAVLLIPWWAASYAFGVPLGTSWPPTLWHGHEMLFGFIVAAIAGFLLTAVPSWTGARGFAGWPLALVSGLWLLGRIAVATSRFWPLPVVATLDLAFLPALAALVSPPLVRARNRNTPLRARRVLGNRRGVLLGPISPQRWRVAPCAHPGNRRRPTPHHGDRRTHRPRVHRLRPQAARCGRNCAGVAWRYGARRRFHDRRRIE